MTPPHLVKSSPGLRLAPALEVRFAGEKSAGEIAGYASVFGGPPDSYGDVIAKGAFARTLAEMKSERVSPAMLWSHDPSAPVGRWVEVREDDQGLLVRGELNLATARGRETHELLKHGDVSGLSIGFMVAQDGSRLAEDRRSTVLTDLDLIEISIVAIPANRRARVVDVKTLNSKSDLIEMLRDGGLSKAAAARVAAGGWPALAGEDLTKATALAAQIARATATLRNL